jgi:hypothetical protein
MRLSYRCGDNEKGHREGGPFFCCAAWLKSAYTRAYINNFALNSSD